MKKLLFMLLCVAVLASCNKNDVKLEEQKIAVDIDLLTPVDNGLSVKSQSETVDRENTPACVRTLTVRSEHSSMPVESKVFTFTNPTLWWGSVPGSDENDQTTRTVTGLKMNMWGGQQTITATTTSFVEDWYTDPMSSEADGVSSGGSTAEFIQWGEGTGTDKIADALRAIPPYAIFQTDLPVSYSVDIDQPTAAKLNMITKHSRMVMTFEFEEGVTGYKGVVSFPRYDVNENLISPNEAPNRTFTETDAAWYYWSNDESLNGVSVKPVIKIKQDGKIVRTIDMASLNQNHNNTNINVCTLVAGKDIWNKVIITEGGVKLKGNGFDITYNWDEIDNVVNY
ncbi:MAG: hypothetical protein ACEPOW_13895 [Bacteroidales bacterium]